MALSKIECVIKPHKLEEVKEALAEHGITGITAYEVKGFGRQRGQREIYRGSTYKADFLPKTKLEIVTSDDQVDGVIDVIRKAARTDQIGDGKIWITPVSKVVRIRTGDTGMDAL